MVVSFDEPALAAWAKLQRCGGPPVQRRVPMATRAAMEAGESVYDAAPIANAHAVCQQQAALWHATWPGQPLDRRSNVRVCNINIGAGACVMASL